jgi:hypothetical protein
MSDSMIRFVGDVHGKFKSFKHDIETSNVDNLSIIQVGDMGVGFGQGDYWHESLDEYMVENNVYFLRGNHDNPNSCKTMKSWIKDGTVIDDMMLIGGAWSIDHSYRTPGIDWWEDEELSYGELDALINLYEEKNPRIMVTHDFPTIASYKMFVRTGRSIGRKIQYLNRTAEALQAMFEIHQPTLWIGGHWHTSTDQVIDGTRFICLNELEWADINLDKAEVIRRKYGKWTNVQG